MASPSREIILSKIRKSLAENAIPIPFPEAEKSTDFFVKEDIGIEEKFASEFSKLGGKFVYCANENEAMQQLEALFDTMKWNTIHVKDSFLAQMCKSHNLEFIQEGEDMSNIEVGMSLCECLVARTGSLILSSGQEHGRALPVYSPIHITFAFRSQLVWNISDAIDSMKSKYPSGLPSLISLTTGPSRTADIEKTLVVGVHGPKEVYVFLIDEMLDN